MQLLRSRRSRTGTRNRVLAVGAAAIATAAVMAPGAQAADPTGNFAVFKNCPRANANVGLCFYSETLSGSFKLGNANVPINKKIVLQGGVGINPTTNQAVFYNAVGGPTLSRTPLTVPGGLTGLFDPQPGWNGILTELFEAAINAANGVTATAELVGPVGYDILAFGTGNGAGLTLPLRIKLDNAFLGDNCYIGSASSPVNLRLTTGTTAPPPPNTPITGATGTPDFLENGSVLAINGFKLVDNSFSVPKASGCGPLLFRPLINAAVNLKEGFPSAAGKNTAILQGNVRQANVLDVNANAGS
jgi:hypothetical protein